MKNKNIFIVEDELLVALVYQQYLGKQGFTITGPFTTGEEAIEALSNNTFGAALLDIQLDDEIDGIAVAEHIRKVSQAPIIFTTGNDTKKTELDSAHITNSYILPKPIDFSELLEILNR